MLSEFPIERSPNSPLQNSLGCRDSKCPSAHRRSDVHEEASVKTGARRWRDFPDIPSASSAMAGRQERVFGRSHSTPRRCDSPRRTSGCDLGPGLAEDADRDELVVDIETDVERGCLLKSMDLGTAATGFQVTRLTEASFIVSTTPKHLTALPPAAGSALFLSRPVR